MQKVIEKKGSIIWPFDGVIYNVCTLIQRSTSDGFTYEFIPNYFVLSLIDPIKFEDIQGIDLTRKEKSYYRDFIPVFVYERTPPENREDIDEILQTLGLDYYDPMEIMFKNKDRYGGDNLRVVPYIEKEVVSIESLTKDKEAKEGIASVIRYIAMNNTLSEFKTEKELKAVFESYMVLYRGLSDLYKYGRKEKNEIINPVGRPKIVLQKAFYETLKAYRSGEISMNQAVSRLGLSKSTFIRKMKEVEYTK